MKYLLEKIPENFQDIRKHIMWFLHWTIRMILNHILNFASSTAITNETAFVYVRINLDAICPTRFCGA